MTPQERDLITALLARLKAQGTQPKDAEAEALIRQGMQAQPDAPYLLVQTVLIQDMALNAAQSRIAELERQRAEAKTAPAPQEQPTSFLGGAGHGSVPSAGAWPRSAPASPGQAPVWTQSHDGAPQPAAPTGPVPPTMMPGAGSGFLRQAAATAAGIAGGALLFQGIQSLFGPHYYGSNWLAGTPMQPGLSETVINNYYGDQNAGDQNAPDTTQADAGDQGMDQPFDPGQDYAQDQDVSDGDLGGQDSGGDDGNYDV